MREPRPFGLHGAPLKGDEDIAVVTALTRNLTNIKRTGSLDSLKMVRALPGGGVAIAIDMGGTFRVIVQRDDEKEPEYFDGLARTYVPMMFSGIIHSESVIDGEGAEVEITDMTRRRLAGYGEKVAGMAQEMPGSKHTLVRFAVPYGPRHSELDPKSPSRTYLQSHALRPSWFSGSMAAVVQTAFGYGVSDIRKLPDTPIERARMVLPEEVQRKIETELGDKLLPGYSGTPPEKGEIQFDYKFHETHGVMFDNERSPWLVRVNTRGVYSMPLPVIPASTTKAFREYIEEKGDDELLWLLDRFGGMPSGESFPRGEEAFEAWRRAGVVIKMCDTSDFYHHSAYSTVCGWSFNESGTAAVNTCWNFGDDGIQRGYMYRLGGSLGAAKGSGIIPNAWESAGVNTQMLNEYLSALMRAAGGRKTSRGAALLYKLRRTPVRELISRAATGYREGDAEYWDALDSGPIANHSCFVKKIRDGKLWAPGEPKNHPQIKFPEPMMNPPGCVSHDFGRLEGSPIPVIRPRCDTVMFAYHVGDDMKTVKYFYDDRGYLQETLDNYEECMTVGAWERVETRGQTALLGHFSSSDFDEREAAAPVTTTTNIVGTDLGFDSVPHFSFQHLFAMSGSIWRNRYYRHETKSKTTEGFYKQIGVLVPYLHRNALLYAHDVGISGGKFTHSVQRGAIQDPNTYPYFTYDFVFAWYGGPPTEGNAGFVAPGKMQPYPRGGEPVWVVAHNYYPVACSDFADEGDWMGGLPQDYTWLIHPNKNEWRHSGGGGAPNIRTFSNIEHLPAEKNGLLQISISIDNNVINEEPNPWYFEISPSEWGDVFYVDAISNKAGDIEYSSCSEPDINSLKQRSRWGHMKLADHKKAHHFMGVINE